MQPLQASPEGCEPAKVFDADGALLAKLGCGDAFTCPASPPPSPACSVSSVGWVFDYRAFYPPFVSSPSADFPLGGPLVNVDENVGGRAVRIDVTPPAWMPDFWWGEHDAFVFYGVPEGDAIAGVSWTWEISGLADAEAAIDAAGAQWSGLIVDSVGPLLRVRIGDLDPADAVWSVTITATARCGTEEVGTLSMVIGASGGYGGY